MSPAVNRIVNEKGLNPKDITPTGPKGNITKADAMSAQAAAPAKPQAPTPLPSPGAGQIAQEQTREKMTRLRQTIATRLVEAQHTAAILTTFNEIDMSATMELRSHYKDSFQKKHNVKLGFMGFFTKAVIEALKAFPRVNAQIDGDEIVYNHFHNIGIAVGTEKGLVVPVVRHADFLSLAEIELSIKHYGEKARDGKITVDDLSGGTFTISNGGVYGSMMSTPILNPPQSGILGLHKIEQRPVAIDGKVEIRPMMYVALSYDHRMVDGKEAVGFLVRIKECMEDPARMLLEI
jgi:2-oxoglutarate dehydrogenase E2 component (dihydrolipoamide succinyltransferase)